MAVKPSTTWGLCMSFMMALKIISSTGRALRIRPAHTVQFFRTALAAVKDASMGKGCCPKRKDSRGPPAPASLLVHRKLGGVALAGATSVCRYFTQLMGSRAIRARAEQNEQGAKKLDRVGNTFTAIAI